MSHDVNVLFTSVGRRVELVRAFRRAYATLGLWGRIVATDIDPLAPALQEVDAFYLVPRVADDGYVAAVAEVCRRERVHLVFPLIDPEIPVLARSRAEIEASGARLMVVSDRAAEITSDKWLTHGFFQGLGVPTPRTWLPPDLPWGDLEYPVFIKPRFGSAGKHTFAVRTERELAFFLDYVHQPLVQEHLEGPEVTNDVVCDHDGAVLGVIERRRIEVRWGEVAKGVTIHDAAIRDACVRIAGALPATGPITVQCMMHRGSAHFTEINARLGGGTPLAVAAGADFPAWLLARVAGIAYAVPPLGTYQGGLYLTRYDDSVFLDEAARDAATRRRL